MIPSHEASDGRVRPVAEPLYGLAAAGKAESPSNRIPRRRHLLLGGLGAAEIAKKTLALDEPAQLYATGPAEFS
jgi:hypothetical protein